jgi:hypothetical protein
MSIILRVFNIPESKTKNELESEFSILDIPIVSITLPMKTEEINAGYALVEFENEETKSKFAAYFSILRHDLVIYKFLNSASLL